ncbi:MAG: Flp family type IVb pilin [Rubripirellula sp.]
MIKPSTRKAIVDFLAEEDGPTAVEYAVMLAMIIGVCFASVSFLANNTAESFNTSANAISGAFGN